MGYGAPTAGSCRTGIAGTVLALILTTLAGLPAAEHAVTDRATDADPPPAGPTAWPQRSSSDGWTFTVYQPQPERLPCAMATASRGSARPG
jgi:hypothetical protein